MMWSEFLEKLQNRGYHPEYLEHSPGKVELVFNDSDGGRMFAGSLLAWGIPRTYKNNYVNSTVSFNEFYVPRILEIL